MASRGQRRGGSAPRWPGCAPLPQRGASFSETARHAGSPLCRPQPPPSSCAHGNISKPLPRCQANFKEESELLAELKDSSHSQADFGGRWGGRRPRVRWLQFSARAARFFGLRWKLARGGRGRRRRGEETGGGVRAASWTRTRLG